MVIMPFEGLGKGSSGQYVEGSGQPFAEPLRRSVRIEHAGHHQANSLIQLKKLDQFLQSFRFELDIRV